MKRIWDVIVGVTMIVLGAVVQFIFFGLLLFPCFAFGEAIGITKANLSVFGYASGITIILTLNLIAFWEYFRKRRMATFGDGVYKLKAIVSPDSAHIAGSIVLLPRGVDRIINGV